MSWSAGDHARKLAEALAAWRRPDLSGCKPLGRLVQTGSDNIPFLIAALRAFDAYLRGDRPMIARISALVIEYYDREPFGADEQDSLNAYMAWREGSLFLLAAICGEDLVHQAGARKNVRALVARCGLLALPGVEIREIRSGEFPGAIVANGPVVRGSTAVVFPGRRSAVDKTIGHLNDATGGAILAQAARIPGWALFQPKSFVTVVVKATVEHFGVTPWLLDDTEAKVAAQLLGAWPKLRSAVAVARRWASAKPAKFPVSVRYYERAVAALLERSPTNSTDEVALHAAALDGWRVCASAADGDRDTKRQGGQEGEWVDDYTARLHSKEPGGGVLEVSLPRERFGALVEEFSLDGPLPAPVPKPQPPTEEAPPPRRSSGGGCLNLLVVLLIGGLAAACAAWM